METLVLDFETFFSSDFSLKKMPTLRFIRSSEFKVHGAAVKRNDQPAEWVSRDALPGYFAALPWPELTVISHNSNFDMTILFEKYGCSPGRRVDTLALCRMLLPHDLDFDLGSIAPLLGLGEKGKDLDETKGHRDLTPELEAKLAAYAVQDAELEYGIYQLLMPELPAESADWMDLVIRMSSEGTLLFDKDMARTALNEAILERNSKIAATGYTETQLRSRDLFPVLLREAGVEPPTKISPRTGKETWAFSKQDPAFVALRSNPEVAVLIEGRLAASSNNAITRIENLIAISEVEPYTIPVQLNTSGAHTHRLSGGGGINMQNLNNGSALRLAIHVPDDCFLLVADSSQIELRMNMWFSGQFDVVTLLGTGDYVYDEDHVEWKGGDVYRKEAAAQFGVPPEEITKPQRQYGKVVQLGCLAKNTQVLVFDTTIAAPCLKPIQSVNSTDLVWDGIEWVLHRGLLNQGIKPVVNVDGAWMTPDHPVLSSDNWIPALCLEHGGDLLYRALETGSANLPSPDTNWGCAEESSASSSSVVAVRQNTVYSPRISATASLHGVIDALRSKPATGSSATGATPTSSLTKSTGQDFSIASLPAFSGAITRRTLGSPTMVPGASAFMRLGGRIANSFLRTSSRLKAGMFRVLSSIGSTSTRATSRTIFASSTVQPTCATEEPFNNYRQRSSDFEQRMPTYDLALAGPRNRFTIKTNSGYLLVHNCGYGMGPPKFRATCAIGPMGNPPIYISEEEAYRTITTYRSNHPYVKGSWDWNNEVGVPAMYAGTRVERGPVVFEKEAILLPDGMRLLYPGLEPTEDGYSWGVNGVSHRIYGGILQENIVQALAGIAIKQQALAIARELPHLKLVHQVHDELIMVCPKSEARSSMLAVAEIMSRELPWAPGLPLRCEAAFAQNYSK